jgi:serine/threonine protein kinase
LSKSLDNSDFLNTTVGSPHYVAPEVLLGTGHGKPVDIWAIGVIAFVLLCGYTPFWGGENNSNEIMYQQICSGKFDFEHEYWQYISDAAKEFITMCLTVDPNSRLTSKDALAHSWLRTKATVDLLPTVRKNFNARRTFKKGFFLLI